MVHFFRKETIMRHEAGDPTILSGTELMAILNDNNSDAVKKQLSAVFQYINSKPDFPDRIEMLGKIKDALSKIDLAKTVWDEALDDAEILLVDLGELKDAFEHKLFEH